MGEVCVLGGCFILRDETLSKVLRLSSRLYIVMATRPSLRSDEGFDKFRRQCIGELILNLARHIAILSPFQPLSWARVKKCLATRD